MLSRFMAVSLCSLLTMNMAYANNTPTSKPDSHAPIGVMGDHLHKQGEWMAAYKLKRTKETGFRNGNDKVSNNSVLTRFGEGAIEMDMDMHMFELMYGVTNDVTVMVMPQYMRMGMVHKSLHGGGHSHEHKVDGLGDTEATALISFFRNDSGEVKHQAHANLGASLPTGAIDKTFADHHNNVYHLPYNMQFGSGTVDPIIGATYTGESPDWSWGAQTLNTIRLYENHHDWQQGNKYTANVWAAKNITSFASISLRLEGEAWDDVSGRDVTLPVNVIAGANPNELSGERLLAHVGLNLLGTHEHGALKGHRLAVEFGVPVYQRFSGPQNDMDYRLQLGWQYAF